MPDYVIKGSVRDNQENKITDVKVQAMNSDHRLLQYHNDEMLGNVWVDSDGKFEISFDKKDFYSGFFESNPDLYLIIRNSFGQIIKKTEIRKGVKSSDIKNLTFDIKLNSTQETVPYSENPYSNSIDIVMSSFEKFADIFHMHGTKIPKELGVSFLAVEEDKQKGSRIGLYYLLKRIS